MEEAFEEETLTSPAPLKVEGFYRLWAQIWQQQPLIWLLLACATGAIGGRLHEKSLGDSGD